MKTISLSVFKFLVYLAVLLSILFLTISNPVGAQETESATEVELAFPVKELGDCKDYNSCLNYCDDPVNYNQCVDFAKKNNFHKEDKVQAATDEFWEKTEEDLGCSSQEACLTFCEDPSNHQKCDAFAKQEDIVGGYVAEPDKPEFLEKAKEVLGCDSAGTCSNFCDDPANAQKCTEFANEVSLQGGEVRQGPGGCTSESTCQSFCSDPNNFNACSPFTPTGSEGFKGPGGCDSPESCRSHCEQNPNDCRSYAPGANGQYVPVTCPEGQYFGPGGVCTSTEKTVEANQCAGGTKYWDGSSCQEQAPPGITPEVGGAFFQARPDMGNCKTPGECYDFCKENPGKCQGIKTDAPRPPDTYVPTLYYTPGTVVKHAPVEEMGGCTTPGGCYDFCKENPAKCQGFNANAPRPLDNYAPGTYYTPPTDFAYNTPPATNFYVTPMYYTPPTGSNYTTPSYYTPGIYSTPSYYTPPAGNNYTTPNYYTPGSSYVTPTGEYPTPSYTTPKYYTPPAGSNYTTPTYYSPAAYVTPKYYTPPAGSNYVTPNYQTPPAYVTPTYFTPATVDGKYTTPTYYTPPAGSNYTTPNYPSPANYTPPQPGSSTSNYPSPTYYTPPAGSNYTTPNYVTPPTTSTYTTPPNTYVTPPTYNTPPTEYPSPAYNTPPAEYASPAYNSPPAYETPAYNSPPAYVTPPTVQGVSKERGILETIWDFLTK